MVSFTPQPLYPQGKSPRYLLDRRLSGPQSRSGRLGEEKILDPTRTLNSDLLVVQPIGSHYTDYAILAPPILFMVITVFECDSNRSQFSFYEYLLECTLISSGLHA
jgi:hypothetical protein